MFWRPETPPGKERTMRTGVGLLVIAVGAILAFAVTANTKFVNFHTVGWVLILVGVIGMLIPRRTYGWVGRRLLVKRTRQWPGDGAPANETTEGRNIPPYVTHNPGTSRIRAGLPPKSSLLTDSRGSVEDPVEEGIRPTPGDTEVIEDMYEE
jgi:hypothetical protein